MAENALPNGLPYPTPTRLRLADAIAAGQVKHYHWVKPWSCDTVRDANVTARVAELVAAGLASVPDPGPAEIETFVRLTPDGMAWVTRARTSKISTEGEGPGSTSPEPGPPAEVTHACPPLGTGVTPCCGRTPFELPTTDRMTLQSDLVNCPAGHSTEDGAE